jgi:hypothetical protein
MSVSFHVLITPFWDDYSVSICGFLIEPTVSKSEMSGFLLARLSGGGEKVNACMPHKLHEV